MVLRSLLGVQPLPSLLTVALQGPRHPEVTLFLQSNFSTKLQLLQGTIALPCGS